MSGSPNPQRNLKEQIENNLVIFTTIIFVTAFGMGYGTYKTLVNDIDQNQKIKIKDLERKIQLLEEENKGIKTTINPGIRIFYNNKKGKDEIENFIRYLKDGRNLNNIISPLVTSPPNYHDYNSCSKDSEIKYFNKEDELWASKIQELSTKYFNFHDKDKKFKAEFIRNQYSIEQAPFSIEVWIATNECK